MPTRIDWITSFRRLRRKPIYTLTVALALGIGIGAATIVFSWFAGLFLKPLPGVRDSASLQVFELRRADYDTTAFSYPDYKDIAEGVGQAMDVAAYSMSRVTLNGTGKPEQQWVLFVSSNFFPVMELKPGAGQLIDSTVAGTEAVAVLGYDWWQTRFKGDQAIVGRTIYVNRLPVKVIGVASKGFQGPYTGLSLGLYLPVSLSDSIELGKPRIDNRRARWLNLVGRLKPQVTSGQASEAMRVVVTRLDQTYPKGTFEQAQVVLRPFWRSPVGAQAIMGPVMMALAGVVLVVLLLACSNATGVMLLENAFRRRDMSIRVSLGASGSGLVALCLTEAVILAALGAGAGLFITHLAAGRLGSLVPDIQFPVSLSFPVDTPVLVFSIVAASVTAIFCGLWSGLEASWKSAVKVQSEVVTASPSRERSRVRTVFIGAQIALSFLLLSSAALIYRSVERARTVDLGFDAQSVSIARIDVAGNRYTQDAGLALFRRVLSRLKETPGVENASLAKSVPLGLGDQERVTVVPDGLPPADVWANRVSPGYFDTLSIPLLAGREFTDLDRDNSGHVAIVNEALARQLWNSRSALESFFYLGSERYRVIGVVRNTKVRSLTAESQPLLYLPLWQFYTPNVAIHVKSRQPSPWIHRLIEKEMEQQDPLLPVVSVQTMAQQVSATLFPQRIALVMIGIFCALGIYLTAIGLYGVIAHAARSRAKEIAIRMALGASPAQIGRLVTRQTAAIVGTGLCIGAALTAALRPLLSSVLVGADNAGWLSMAQTAVLITAVAIFATWIPTFRAMRVQAATALRAE